MKMNLPNKLTVLRLCLVPVIIIIGMLPNTVIPFYVSCVICAALFIGTAVTDMLDGKIARRDGLVTDFGKFLDPVADKFMVIGTLFVILYKFPHLQTLMIFTLIIIVFRELAVTSMRLVVSTGEGIVVAANILGKIKTVSQMVGTIVILVEPALPMIIQLDAVKFVADNHILSYIAMAVMAITTIVSGIDYLKAYMPYIDSNK